MKKILVIVFILFFIIESHAMSAEIPNPAKTNADKIVQAGFNYMRGKASVSTVIMKIQRPDWKREVTIKAWTRGEKESIFQIIAPAKDKGSGTLKKGHEMWTYNPKINRVIKLPPSMMSQAWMGSDFSNNDLAKSDSLLHDYIHTLEGTETHEEKIVYLIKSMPKPDAPVVWGMQKLKIRQDNILLVQEFYDEDLKLVKKMVSSQIQMMGRRMFPKFTKMQKSGTLSDEFTLLEYVELEFKDTLPDNMFTISELKNIRR